MQNGQCKLKHTQLQRTLWSGRPKGAGSFVCVFLRLSLALIHWIVSLCQSRARGARGARKWSGRVNLAPNKPASR